MSGVFEVDLSRLQPSQLYINEEKLRTVMAEVRAGEPASVRPIPIRPLAGCAVMTDGHTRALSGDARGAAEEARGQVNAGARIPRAARRPP
jgi:hypothetical protein